MKTAGWTALAIGLALASGSLALAKPDKPAKQEKPATALKRGFKELRKLKSYRVDFQVQGGTAQGPAHAPKDTRVNQSWSAQVRGKVDNLNGGVAFRLRPGADNGAIQAGGQWKALLATDQGRLISRLFQGPELALADALKSSRRALWVEPAPEAERPSAPAGAGVRGAPSGSGQETQTREEGQSSSASEAQEGPRSHVIRIEGQPVEAVTNFNRIVTSGCFSEG